MKPERYHVYFEDEARIIGSGWRPVIARIGYKWVHIKTPNAERGTRIKREIWDKLRKDFPMKRSLEANGRIGLYISGLPN